MIMTSWWQPSLQTSRSGHFIVLQFALKLMARLMQLQLLLSTALSVAAVILTEPVCLCAQVDTPGRSYSQARLRLLLPSPMSCLQSFTQSEFDKMPFYGLTSNNLAAVSLPYQYSSAISKIKTELLT